MQRVPDNIGIVSAIKENIEQTIQWVWPAFTLIFARIQSLLIFMKIQKIQKLIGIVSAIIENEAADNGVDHNFTIYSLFLSYLLVYPILLLIFGIGTSIRNVEF